MARDYALWTCSRFLVLLVGLLLAGVSQANSVDTGGMQELRFQRVMEDSEAIKKNASALMTVVQDNSGFMWFGGENGLARFDGLQFKRYEPSPEPGAPPSNIVRDLLIDHDGVMWIATDRGLCRYVEREDRFDVFRPVLDDPTTLPHNVITSLALDQHNRLIVGTGSGISIFSADRSRFASFPLTAGTQAVTFVLDTFVDSKNRIWVGTRDYGLFLLDQDGDVLRHFVAAVGNPGALQSDVVKSVEEDQFGRIWVGTYGGGVSRLNEGERDFTSYLADPSDPHAIGSNTIWDIFLDSADVLWLSTDQGGLARYQVDSDSFVHYRHSAFDRNTLASNQVQAIYEDRERNLWITTFPDGINFYDRSHSEVTNYTQRQNDLNSLSSSAVLDFMQTADGLLWIGTENGLNLFDMDQRRFVRRYVRDPSSRAGLQANAGVEEHHVRAGRTRGRLLPDVREADPGSSVCVERGELPGTLGHVEQPDPVVVVACRPEVRVVVPRSEQRVRDVQATPVERELEHLWPAVQLASGVARLAEQPAEPQAAFANGAMAHCLDFDDRTPWGGAFEQFGRASGICACCVRPPHRMASPNGRGARIASLADISRMPE